MTDTAAPAIEIRGLRKRFRLQTVLDGIDLTVARGQVFGYIGPNGAGKTTTVKILVGMLDGFEGSARVAGYDVFTQPLEVKRRIGYLPESAQLYDALTVAEHLLLVGRLHGLPDELAIDRGGRLLEILELQARAKSRIGALSKGMRQKLMIASALLHDPEILFFDEPLSGLDVHATVLIKEVLRALAGQGKTIFYCSHLMDIVERVCDRVAILDHGRIVASGTRAELLAGAGQDDTLERIFLQVTGHDAAREQARDLLAALADAQGRGEP